jgi:folylpolyglutamate synthase/dihydropteroate synthase
MKGIDHQGWLGDRVTNIAKKIGELLEPVEVVGDGQIGLERAVELLQGIHGALVHVVEEEKRPWRDLQSACAVGLRRNTIFMICGDTEL